MKNKTSKIILNKIENGVHKVVNLNNDEQKKVKDVILYLLDNNLKYRLTNDKDIKSLKGYLIGYSEDTFEYLKSSMQDHRLVIEGKRDSWSDQMYEIDSMLREYIKSNGQKSTIHLTRSDNVLLNKYGHEIQADINFKNLTLAEEKKKKSLLNISDDTTSRILAKEDK